MNDSKPETQNSKPERKAMPSPPCDRMLRGAAKTRDVLGRDFHALAGTDGKPKHDHD